MDIKASAFSTNTIQNNNDADIIQSGYQIRPKEKWVSDYLHLLIFFVGALPYGERRKVWGARSLPEATPFRSLYRGCSLWLLLARVALSLVPCRPRARALVSHRLLTSIAFVGLAPSKCRGRTRHYALTGVGGRAPLRYARPPTPSRAPLARPAPSPLQPPAHSIRQDSTFRAPRPTLRALSGLSISVLAALGSGRFRSRRLGAATPLLSLRSIRYVAAPTFFSPTGSATRSRRYGQTARRRWALRYASVSVATPFATLRVWRLTPPLRFVPPRLLCAQPSALIGVRERFAHPPQYLSPTGCATLSAICVGLRAPLPVWLYNRPSGRCGSAKLACLALRLVSAISPCNTRLCFALLSVLYGHRLTVAKSVAALPIDAH